MIILLTGQYICQECALLRHKTRGDIARHKIHGGFVLEESFSHKCMTALMTSHQLTFNQYQGKTTLSS